MNFDHSEKTQELLDRVRAFMAEHVEPNEMVYYEQLDSGETRWQTPPIMKELKVKAKVEGLWNLFLPASDLGAGLTNLEYAPLCEVMGRIHWAPEVFNCSAPDTGNMEVLAKYGSDAQKEQWLQPLMNGEIRSAFLSDF